MSSTRPVVLGNVLVSTSSAVVYAMSHFVNSLGKVTHDDNSSYHAQGLKSTAWALNISALMSFGPQLQDTLSVVVMREGLLGVVHRCSRVQEE